MQRKCESNNGTKDSMHSFLSIPASKYLWQNKMNSIKQYFLQFSQNGGIWKKPLFAMSESQSPKS
jgi:hypothetical protein